MPIALPTSDYRASSCRNSNESAERPGTSPRLTPPARSHRLTTSPPRLGAGGVTVRDQMNVDPPSLPIPTTVTSDRGDRFLGHDHRRGRGARAVAAQRPVDDGGCGRGARDRRGRGVERAHSPGDGAARQRCCSRSSPSSRASSCSSPRMICWRCSPASAWRSRRWRSAGTRWPRPRLAHLRTDTWRPGAGRDEARADHEPEVRRRKGRKVQAGGRVPRPWHRASGPSAGRRPRAAGRGRDRTRSGRDRDGGRGRVAGLGRIGRRASGRRARRGARWHPQPLRARPGPRPR